MSDHRNKRVNNVRLVRLPDGRLVSEAEAAAYRPSKKPQPLPEVTSIESVPEAPKPKPKNSKKVSLKSKLQKLAQDQIDKNKKPSHQPTPKATPPSPKVIRATTSDPSPEQKKVEISIAFPKFKRPRATAKQLKIAGVVVVALVGFGVYQKTINKQSSQSDVLSDSSQKVEEIPLNQSPEFAVLLPAGKAIEQLGGFARISPAESAPAYAYADTVGGVKIKLTQQEIPDTFKGDPTAELEKVAQNFNATKLLQIDQNNVYVGKSEKGPQTLIMVKGGLLVFITAEREVPEVDWVPYIAGLHQEES